MEQETTDIYGGHFIAETWSKDDVIRLLVQHGCPDLTSSIDLNACTDLPLAGGSSDVYKGALSDNTRVAIKVSRVYDAQIEKEQKQAGRSILQGVAKELYILSKLRHPNILPLIGMAHFRGQLSMVTEWMENGSLRTFIALNPNANRFQLGMDVCAGLCYLHDSGVVHGDLKAANVLVSAEGAAMIADFDNSMLIDANLPFEVDSERGISVRWAAPERMRSFSIQGPKTRSTDVYAFGMTLLEIITGQVPFPTYNEYWVPMLMGSQPDALERPPVGLDDISWVLLLSCVAPSPSRRPTAGDIQTSLQAILHDWNSSPDKRGSNPWDFLDPSEQVKTPTQAPDGGRDRIIGTNTPTKDIMAMLVKRGCRDLTDTIDHSLCGQNPYTAGGFGDIYRGALQSGPIVAIKTLLLRTDSTEINVQGKIQKRTARELYHWARLKHPNVLPLAGFALFRGQVSMVSEWMQGGSIVSYLKSNPNANRIQLCVDICAGLCYIHAEDMVHGDLKGANVMVSSDGVAVIGDFGNADLQELQSNFTRTAQRPGVSIRWASPELLLRENATSNKESDVYAYGMTVLETVTGNIPFKGRSIFEVMLMHRAGEAHPRPPGMSDRLWDLLATCCARDISQRAKITTVMTRLEPLVADADAVYRALCEDQNMPSEGSDKAQGTKLKQTRPAIESDYITCPPDTTMSYYEHYTRSFPVSAILSPAKLPPNPEYVTAPEMNTVYHTAPLGRFSL